MPLGSITHDALVPGSPERVFEMFCALGAWWPLAYTFSADRFADAGIEPRPGGVWYERDREGKRLEWGDVRKFEPAQRLVLGFAIGPDRQPAPAGTASEVEIRFVPAGADTRVEIEHRDLDRHREGAAAMRAGMASSQGWPLILAEFGRAIRQGRRTSRER